jgi:SAM-dependent methyltransferase
MGHLEFTQQRDAIQCQKCADQFLFSNGKPILVRKDNRLFSSIASDAKPARTSVTELLAAIVPSPSVNLSRAIAYRKISDMILGKLTPTVLVVGAGHQRPEISAALSSILGVRLLCTDVDLNDDIDIFCDAHDLPFADEVFDVVIATAVLEHVMYPERVASEMHRVVKGSGLIYSELPFMQQVHEGAYDFTRYTLSGHRRLLHGFQEVTSGLVAGPGTVLAWSIEHFFLAFATANISRTIVKVLVRIAFSWLKYFDYFLEHRVQAVDGASCTFFLGSKVSRSVSDEEIIALYRGAGRGSR